MRPAVFLLSVACYAPADEGPTWYDCTCAARMTTTDYYWSGAMDPSLCRMPGDSTVADDAARECADEGIAQGFPTIDCECTCDRSGDAC